MPEYNEVLKASEDNQTFKSGSRRDSNKGKGRFDLIPPWGLIRLAKHYENGAEKYGDRNWEKGQPISRYVNSIFRHLVKYIGGDREEDHMAAIAWNAMAIMDHEERLERGLIDPSIVNENPLLPEGANFRKGEFQSKSASETKNLAPHPSTENNLNPPNSYKLQSSVLR